MKSAVTLKEALQNRIYVMISELLTSKSGAHHLSPEIKRALKTALASGEIVRVESPYTSNINSLQAIDAASVVFLDLQWIAIPQSKTTASVKFRFKYN